MIGASSKERPKVTSLGTFFWCIIVYSLSSRSIAQNDFCIKEILLKGNNSLFEKYLNFLLSSIVPQTSERLKMQKDTQKKCSLYFYFLLIATCLFFE